MDLYNKIKQIKRKIKTSEVMKKQQNRLSNQIFNISKKREKITSGFGKLITCIDKLEMIGNNIWKKKKTNNNKKKFFSKGYRDTVDHIFSSFFFLEMNQLSEHRR